MARVNIQIVIYKLCHDIFLFIEGIIRERNGYRFPQTVTNPISLSFTEIQISCFHLFCNLTY